MLSIALTSTGVILQNYIRMVSSGHASSLHADRLLFCLDCKEADAQKRSFENQLQGSMILSWAH